MSLRRGASAIANRLLRPFDVEIRRRFSGGPRRVTMLAALERLKSLGFEPATVIDVGVASGTEELSMVFPRARHLLIEPMREFEANLRSIAGRLPRAEVILAAAGEAAGQATLNVGADLQLTSRGRVLDLAFPVHEQRVVPMVALDDVWRERGLQAPGLLKVDVEGSEIAVLRGAGEVLKQADCVVLECWFRRVFADAPLVDATLQDMAARGFLVDDFTELAYGPDGSLRKADCLFVREGSDLARKLGR
jgi:FkbM family methyltransferase